MKMAYSETQISENIQNETPRSLPNDSNIFLSGRVRPIFRGNFNFDKEHLSLDRKKSLIIKKRVVVMVSLETRVPENELSGNLDI